MPLVHTRLVVDLPRFILLTDENDVATDGDRLGPLLEISSPPCCMASSSVPPLTGETVGSS